MVKLNVNVTEGGNPGLLPTLPDDRCEHLRDSVGPAHYMTADCRIVPHIP